MNYSKCAWLSSYILPALVYMRSYFRKRTFGQKRLATIQISLRFRAVWSESSLCAFWIAKNAKCLHVDNEGSAQTVQMSETTISHVTTHSFNYFGAKFQTTFVVCFFSLTNYRLERSLYVKLKDWISNSVDPDETAHSMLFAKVYYYRLWQWKG